MDGDKLVRIKLSLLLGAFLTPNAYTLSGVMAVNGSHANGDCPTECVVLQSGINTCDCSDSTLGDEAITASVLIDGVVPTIDTSERNSADEFVWAAPLLTVRASTGSVTLGFRFQTRVVLCEVELYVFHCPAWGIGAEDIIIHNGAAFPTFITGIFPNGGRVPLTDDMQNCTSLTRVFIPLQMATSTSSYFIEINSVSGRIEWVHIAEVRFSNHSTTMATTDLTSTGELATGEHEILSLNDNNSPLTIGITSNDVTTKEFPSTPTMNLAETTFQTHTPLLPDTTSSAIPTSHTSQPPTISSTAISSITATMVVVMVLLLMGVGGVLCVLRVRSSRSEVRGDSDRVYDTIQEREVIATERNTAYGHVGVGGGGGVGSGDRAGVEMMRNVAYGHVGEGGGGGVGSGDRAGVEMMRNVAYGHVGEGGGGAVGSGDRAGVEMMRNVAYGHVGEGGGGGVGSGGKEGRQHTAM